MTKTTGARDTGQRLYSVGGVLGGMVISVFMSAVFGTMLSGLGRPGHPSEWVLFSIPFLVFFAPYVLGIVLYHTCSRCRAALRRARMRELARKGGKGFSAMKVAREASDWHGVVRPHLLDRGRNQDDQAPR